MATGIELQISQTAWRNQRFSQARKNKPSITEKRSESTSGTTAHLLQRPLDRAVFFRTGHPNWTREEKENGKPLRVTFTASSSSVTQSHSKRVVIIPSGSIKLAPTPRTSCPLIPLSPRQTLVTVSQLTDTNIETLSVTGFIHPEQLRRRKALVVIAAT